MKTNLPQFLDKPALEGLIHEVNSRCSGLKSVVGLLRNASPEEAKELLALMNQQARSLIQAITAHGDKLGS